MIKFKLVVLNDKQYYTNQIVFNSHTVFVSVLLSVHVYTEVLWLVLVSVVKMTLYILIMLKRWFHRSDTPTHKMSETLLRRTMTRPAKVSECSLDVATTFISPSLSTCEKGRTSSGPLTTISYSTASFPPLSVYGMV